MGPPTLLVVVQAVMALAGLEKEPQFCHGDRGQARTLWEGVSQQQRAVVIDSAQQQQHHQHRDDSAWIIVCFLHQDATSWKFSANRFIHLCTGSTVFHCEIILPQAQAVWTVDARSPVHFTPLNRKTYEQRPWEAFWLQSSQAQFDAARDFLTAQEGRQIDMRGFWNFFLPAWQAGSGPAGPHEWQVGAAPPAGRFGGLQQERWLCSTLIASTLQWADILPADVKPEHVTPSGLRTLLLEHATVEVQAADLKLLVGQPETERRSPFRR